MKMFLALFFGGLAVIPVSAAPASAHQNGCHRWHSCPSDSGSYVCGDQGYSNYCPTSEPTPVTTPTTARLAPVTTAPKPTTTTALPDTTTTEPPATTTTMAPSTTTTMAPSTTTTGETSTTTAPVVLKSEGVVNDQPKEEASATDAFLGLALLGGMGYGGFRGVRRIRNGRGA